MARLTPALGAACAGALLSALLPVMPSARADVTASCPEAILYVARSSGEASSGSDLGAFGSTFAQHMAPELSVPHELVVLRYRLPSVAELRRDPNGHREAMASAAAQLADRVSKDRRVACLAAADLSFFGHGVGAWVVDAALGMLDRETQDHIRRVVALDHPTKVSSKPHIKMSGTRPFRIGQFGSLTVAARGGKPPYTVTLLTPDLDGTGLVSAGGTISGTPTRKLRLKVRASVVDSAGRTAQRTFVLNVDYPDATTQVVTEDNGQNASGYVVADPTVSTGGHLVALASGTDLVPADTNGTTDIYLKNMTSGDLTLITAGADGGPSDAESYLPSISADGSVVVFGSYATNLTSDGLAGVFAYQVETKQLRWLGEGYSPSVSADGSRVAFDDYSGLQVIDLPSGLSTTYPIPSGIGSPQISGDGEKVVYLRYSDDYDGRIELLDLDTSTATTVSTRSDGTVMDFDTWAPSIDFDGTVVAFTGSPEGSGILGSVYEKDLVTGQLTRVQHYVAADRTSLSASGRNLAYGILTCSGDFSAIGYYNSESHDLRIIRDRRAGRGEGGDAVPSISSDGRYVVFASVPDNGPVDVVLADVLVP